MFTVIPILIVVALIVVLSAIKSSRKVFSGLSNVLVAIPKH